MYESVHKKFMVLKLEIIQTRIFSLNGKEMMCFGEKVSLVR